MRLEVLLIHSNELGMHASLRLKLALLMLSCPFLLGAASKQPVRLQLHYLHQFQFAGFYAAQFLGLYDKAGLEVQIDEGAPGLQTVTTVLNGHAAFGVSDTELLWRRLRGEPVVALGVVFQNSAYCLVSLNASNILSLNDLRNKRVGLTEGRGSWLFKAMFLKHQVPLSSFQVLEPRWDLESLIKGEADATQAYCTGELYKLREFGLPFQTIYPMDYGLNFYGDTLFTSEKYLAEQPEVVEKFRKASFEGWRYAFANPEQTIDYILSLPSVKERGVSRERLRYEATVMRHLILPDSVPPGSMNEQRWTQMARELLPVASSKGLHLDHLTGFVYKTPEESMKLLQRRMSWIAGTAALLLSLALIWVYQLRKSVKQRTRALSESKRLAEIRSEEAKQANAAKTLFLAGISHEFRTPLTAIIGFSDILRQSSLGQREDRWMELIHARAEDLLALVNQTLDLIQSETGHIPSQLVDFDLKQQLDEIASSFTPQFQAKDISFAYSLGPNATMRLRGHALALRQIFINLLSNSVKFVPQGGQINVHCYEDRTAAGKDGCLGMHFIHFIVSNNGPSIDAKTAEHLFEPFSSHRRTNEEKGYGLGLAICKRLALTLGGDIWYESSAPGCSFHVTTCFASAASTDADSAAESQELRPIAAGQKRILLVDDDAVNRELIRTYLTMSGFTTAEAENGQTAVSRCESQRYDLIIMDIGLPDFDGVRATEKILNSHRSLNKHTPIIALTASTVFKERDRCLKAGMVAFLTKPIDFENLIFTIRNTASG